MEPAIPGTVEHLFRHESGRMVAILTRWLGTHQVDIAEDLVQQTLVRALEVWKLKGVPERPAAWLMRVARNAAIDHQRRSGRLVSASALGVESPGLSDVSGSAELVPGEVVQIILRF